MNLYHLRYMLNNIAAFKTTKADYFAIIQDEATLNQFIIDEELRSGLTVYCEPSDKGAYDLSLFSTIECDVPGDKMYKIPIFIERKTNESKLN